MINVAAVLNKLPLLLRQTLNRDIKAEKATAPSGPGSQSRITATYENNRGEIVALCICDLELAANLGGALVMVPPSAVNDSLKAKVLDSSLAENFQEVLNICGALFVTPGSEHVKLGRIFAGQAETPQDIRSIPLNGSKDIRISIAGYSGGVISFLAPQNTKKP